jgi:hypothetical protein
MIDGGRSETMWVEHSTIPQLDRSAYPQDIAQAIEDSWLRVRNWWTYQRMAVANQTLCPGCIPHMMFTTGIEQPRYDFNTDPETPIVYTQPTQERVFCPCVVRPPHANRDCTCHHGFSGGNYCAPSEHSQA